MELCCGRHWPQQAAPVTPRLASGSVSFTFRDAFPATARQLHGGLIRPLTLRADRSLLDQQRRRFQPSLELERLLRAVGNRVGGVLVKRIDVGAVHGEASSILVRQEVCKASIRGFDSYPRLQPVPPTCC